MQTESISARITVESLSYRGWAGSLRIVNGIVEAVVVPAIGRVMQFRWVAGGQNVLWEDTKFDGQHSHAKSAGWANFGGDKVWPSPQSQWAQVTGRSWPPPKGLDALPYGAVVSGDSIILTSPIDPHFGLQAVRQITLARSLPVMSVSTSFHKVVGAPVRTGIWVITQMRDAERVYALLPEPSTFRGGFSTLTGQPSESIHVEGHLFSLARDPRFKIKVGLDAHGLLWIGTKDVLRIDADEATGEFPDGGCRTEIYSNPDPSPYLELETLGPLGTLVPGDKIESINTYTLSRRSLVSPLAEARKAYNLE